MYQNPEVDYVALDLLGISEISCGLYEYPFDPLTKIILIICWISIFLTPIIIIIFNVIFEKRPFLNVLIGLLLKSPIIYFFFMYRNYVHSFEETIPITLLDNLSNSILLLILFILEETYILFTIQFLMHYQINE